MEIDKQTQQLIIINIRGTLNILLYNIKANAFTEIIHDYTIRNISMYNNIETTYNKTQRHLYIFVSYSVSDTSTFDECYVFDMNSNQFYSTIKESEMIMLSINKYSIQIEIMNGKINVK